MFALSEVDFPHNDHITKLEMDKLAEIQYELTGIKKTKTKPKTQQPKKKGLNKLSVHICLDNQQKCYFSFFAKI